MKLGEIKQIKQTAEQNEVNEHLGKDYEIIKILSGKINIDGAEYVQPIYILGSKKRSKVGKKY